MEDYMPSSVFWLCAYSFFKAAQKTEETNSPSGHQNDPTYYLAGHALEVALKAFLRAKGFSIEELKDNKKFGHNLVKTLKKAEAAGLGDLIRISDVERNLISLLNEYYCSKELEYYVAGMQRRPRFDLLNAVVEKILSSTKELCHNNMGLHYGKPTAFVPSWAK